MPVVKQVAIAIQDTPNVAASPDGDSVLDILTAEFSRSRELRDSSASTGTLSPTAKPVGRRSSELTVELAVRGSGDAATAPRLAPAILAANFRAVDVLSMALSVALDEQLEVGDLITGNTSTATALVAATAKIGATTVLIVPLAGTWSTAEQVNSATRGSNVGTTHGTAVIGEEPAGVAYKPITFAEVTCDATGSFSGGTPSAGDSVKFRVGATVIGEAEFVSHASDVLTVRMFWGTISAGCVCETTAGETITVDTPAGVAAAVGPQLTARYLRGNRVETIENARTTIEVSADAGADAVLKFTLTGKPGTTVDGVKITPTNLETTTPPRFGRHSTTNVGGANVAGLRMPVRSVQVSVGNTVVQVPDANSVDGEKGGEITGRASTVNLTIEQTGIAALNVQALADAGTTVPVGVEIGTDSGNRFAIIARSAQIAEIADGEDEGIATYQITVNPVTPGDGDDELLFVFS